MHGSPPGKVAGKSIVIVKCESWNFQDFKDFHMFKWNFKESSATKYSRYTIIGKNGFISSFIIFHLCKFPTDNTNQCVFKFSSNFCIVSLEFSNFLGRWLPTLFPSIFASLYGKDISYLKSINITESPSNQRVIFSQFSNLLWTLFPQAQSDLWIVVLRLTSLRLQICWVLNGSWISLIIAHSSPLKKCSEKVPLTQYSDTAGITSDASI